MVREVAIKSGDTLTKVAKAQGTTIEILRKMNPGTAILREGEMLNYQKGAVQRVIVGWRPFTSTMIARRYNGGGDIYYAKKLDYALDVIRKGKEAVCKQG